MVPFLLSCHIYYYDFMYLYKPRTHKWENIQYLPEIGLISSVQFSQVASIFCKWLTCILIYGWDSIVHVSTHFPYPSPCHRMPRLVLYLEFSSSQSESLQHVSHFVSENSQVGGGQSKKLNLEMGRELRASARNQDQWPLLIHFKNWKTFVCFIIHL